MKTPEPEETEKLSQGHWQSGDLNRGLPNAKLRQAIAPQLILQPLLLCLLVAQLQILYCLLNCHGRKEH